MDVEIGTRVITDYGHGEVRDIDKKGIHTAYRVVGSEYDVWLRQSEFDFFDSLFDDVEPDNEELSPLVLDYDDEEGTFIAESDDVELEDDEDEFDEDEEVTDEDFPSPTTLTKNAAWSDVQAKAKTIYESGRVDVVSFADRKIVANVEGSTGTYSTMIKKIPNSQRIAFWSCSCPWGEWAFNRETKYGRLCSHALATQYAMQSLEYGVTSSLEDGDDFDDFDDFDDESAFLLNDPYDGEEENLFMSDREYAEEADSDYFDDRHDEEFDPSLVDEASTIEEENRKVAEDFNEEQNISHLQEGLDYLLDGDGDVADEDIAKSAERFLKNSRKQYTAAEELSLIDEEGVAIQLPELDLSNTHYI